MSSERAALIAAIRAAPDDDAVRLVCADWFEDQGGEANVARAEFIRTQVARANLPPDDVRHSELQARELRLLKRYAPVWCGSHFVFKKVRFQRGFIEVVHLHLRHFLHHRRQMLALEPVRDVSLTGWFRAPDDLVRRVAGCAEWQEIETLRIHHQGPHHDPRSNLVLLLESPHLARLRALHGTHVQFNADARQRFERLPVLRRVRELRMPTLDTWPENPGEWFSDGGAEFANQWGELKSLTLPYYLSVDLLRRITEMPFWNRLTALELIAVWNRSEMLALLRDRLPESLRDLRLDMQMRSGEDAASAADPFFARLARAPLRSLHLFGTISAPALGGLLDGTSRCELRELSLLNCALTEEHARVLDSALGSRTLLALNLSVPRTIRVGVAQFLYSSEHLRSLVHLHLSGPQLGTEGALALASAPGWERLRSLGLVETNLRRDDLRALLASPNVRNLTWFSVSVGSYGPPTTDVPPDAATALTRLPHLACLRLDGWCDPASEQILSSSDSLAWVSINNDDDVDIQTYRAKRAPERSPPVDDGLAHPFAGTRWE
jgi:uncharacterized protein (TIGR02996 family)